MLIDYKNCVELIRACHDLIPKKILHIGAHTGEEAGPYQANGAEHVIWFEANESLIPALQAHLQTVPLNQQIIPAALNYQKSLVESVRGMKEILSPAEFKTVAKTQLELIKEISERVTIIKNDAYLMTEERKKANNLDNAKKQAHAYCEKVKPFFESMRYNVDKLEGIVDDATWPLPKSQA
jgi:glutamine synthetase